MIQKSEEGKEVLDNVYLQVAVSGPTLNIGTVKQTLHNLDNGTRNTIKFLKNLKGQYKASCKAEISAVKGRLYDLSARALAVTRLRKGIERRQKRRANFSKRAGEELSNYQKFRGMIINNHNAWKKFWATASNNIRKVIQLLADARNALHSLKPHMHMEALVEIPESYTITLSEIQNEFDSTYDNLDGLRPVINSLLEVIRSPSKIRQQSVRAKLRNLIFHLTEALNDKLNEFEEENEHQEGLFSALAGVFTNSVNRASTVVEHINKSSARAAKKLTWVTRAEKSAHDLVRSAQGIARMRSAECRHFFLFLHGERARAARILGNISSLQEVIADRWSSVHSFFLQKFQTEEEEN
jgi:hypothetical protein